MTGPLTYVGTHAIKAGKSEEARRGGREMVRFVEANHPRCLLFEISVSPDGEELTVVQVHPDEESLQLHMELAGERIGQAYEYLEATTSIRIFGSPSEAFTAAIEQMAHGAPLAMHRPTAAFSRLGG